MTKQKTVDKALRAHLKARAKAGDIKYGTPLLPFNGRKPERDMVEEALDLAVYSMQAMMEREDMAGRLFVWGEALSDANVSKKWEDVRLIAQLLRVLAADLRKDTERIEPKKKAKKEPGPILKAFEQFEASATEREITYADIAAANEIMKRQNDNYTMADLVSDSKAETDEILTESPASYTWTPEEHQKMVESFLKLEEPVNGLVKAVKERLANEPAPVKPEPLHFEGTTIIRELIKVRDEHEAMERLRKMEHPTCNCIGCEAGFGPRQETIQKATAACSCGGALGCVFSDPLKIEGEFREV